MGNIVTSGQIPDFVAQDFMKIFDDGIKSETPVFDRIFNVLTSKHEFEKMSGATGLPLFVKKYPGKAKTGYGAIKQKFDKTFTHDTLALYSKMAKEPMDDDTSGQLRKVPQKMAISAIQTIETEAATVIDRAQNGSYLGPDGKSLLATDHPRSDGGSWSNRPAVDSDISVTVLETELAAMRGTVDDYGNPLRLMPVLLLGGSEQEFIFKQLLINADKAGTANRDINAIKDRGLKYLLDDYITDPDLWMLLTDKEKRQLIFFWREKINQKVGVASDTSDAIIHEARMRFSKGWVSAYGHHGSIGA